MIYGDGWKAQSPLDEDKKEVIGNGLLMTFLVHRKS